LGGHPARQKPPQILLFVAAPIFLLTGGLIKEDKLARGKLIEVVQGEFQKQENSEYFVFDGEVFETDFDEESPVEYWGSLNHSSKNFITDTEKYPWMPVDISYDNGLPF
jgi:hypothetical protein